MSRRRLFTGGSPVSQGMSTAALAPMVDLFTILLVALLRTWSQDPPLDIVEPGFHLPISREETAAGRGVTIDIAKSGIYVDGWRATSSEYWSEADDVLVSDVLEPLQARGGHSVIIRADRTAPWRLVGKVLFTAQQAGYGDIELVALSRASL